MIRGTGLRRTTEAHWEYVRRRLPAQDQIVMDRAVDHYGAWVAVLPSVTFRGHNYGPLPVMGLPCAPTRVLLADDEIRSALFWTAWEILAFRDEVYVYGWHPGHYLSARDWNCAAFTKRQVKAVMKARPSE